MTIYWGFFFLHKSIVTAHCERLVTFSAYTAKITILSLTAHPAASEIHAAAGMALILYGIIL